MQLIVHQSQCGFESRPARQNSCIIIIMPTPQRDTLRMIFGFSLLVIIAGLTLAIALGAVEEKTSYGLMPLLTMLATLAGGFTQWAFSSKDEPPK